jgi:hypothetical protein
LGGSKPKGLNRIAKIGYVYLYLREIDLYLREVDLYLREVDLYLREIDLSFNKLQYLGTVNFT